jgi:hypothetical protein
MWIENAKYGIKMTGRSRRVQIYKILPIITITHVASQTIRKFPRSGLSSNQESQGMINNELQGIKITSMSMQSFSKI